MIMIYLMCLNSHKSDFLRLLYQKITFEVFRVCTISVVGNWPQAMIVSVFVSCKFRQSRNLIRKLLTVVGEDNGELLKTIICN